MKRGPETRKLTAPIRGHALRRGQENNGEILRSDLPRATISQEPSAAVQRERSMGRSGLHQIGPA